jgi:protocatechuate 3,4-dioxygenase beta subunit
MGVDSSRCGARIRASNARAERDGPEIPEADLKAFPLLAAALLLGACDSGSSAGKPAPAPAPAPPPAVYAPADVAWEPEELNVIAGEEVALPGTGSTWIEGVVVDAAGKPVAGATVEMHAFPRVDTAAIPLLHASTASGPDGRFRVGPGPADWGGQGMLSARAPGFARTSLRGRDMTVPGEPCVDEGVEARIVLRPGIPVRGEVRGEDGGPPDGPVLAWIASRRFDEVVKSDAAGDFTFTAPADRCSVSVVDGAHPRTKAYVDVAAEGENRVRLVVRRGSDVRGRVVDAESGRPVPGAAIRAYWGEGRIFRAGPEGEFLLPRYWFQVIQVRAPGYAAQTHSLLEDQGGARLGNEVVRLERGFAARGRVIDADGKPAAGVRLKHFHLGPTGDWVVTGGPVSRSDGTYVFVGLPLPTKEREVRVFASVYGRAVTASAPLAATAGVVVDGADVRLGALADVEGRVEDEKGAPAVGDVILEWDIPGGLARYAPLVPGGAVCSTGPDGRFRSRAPAGVVVRAKAMGPLFLDGTGEGKPPAPVVVKVFRGLVMKGRVVDSLGDPVTRGSVHVSPNPPGDPRPERDAFLTAEGTFEVGGLVEGLYDASIAVRPEFLHEAIRGLRAGGEPLTLHAHRPGWLKGRLVLPEGAPAGLLPEVTVRALGDSRPLPPVLSTKVGTADRRFALGPLAPGAYAFSAVAGEWRRDMEKVEVVEAPGTEMGDVTFAPAGAVAGTVRVLGKPAAGVPLEVLRFLPGGGSEFCAKGETGPDGTYRVIGLRPGSHVVAFRPRERPVLESKFEAAAAATTTLDVDVPAGVRLAVKVLGADGKPAPNARVTISGPSGGVAYWREGGASPGTHTTGDDGVLRCSGLPAGELRVSASLPGGGAGESVVTVADGADSPVEVILHK